MAELEAIAETLRRQRKDLEELMDGSSSRSATAAELVLKIEELRRRSEEAKRRFGPAAVKSDSPKSK